MATDDHRFQKVRDETKEEQGCPSEGEWVTLIHDCYTPSIQEIEDRGAAVGTVWRCGGDKGCGDAWKLISRPTQSSHGPISPVILQWTRITPHPDIKE